jgi:hypothetical protein
MSKIIRIGHASQSEFASKYGYAGDQGFRNGGMLFEEVREDQHADITAFGFNVLLRPNYELFPELAELSAMACEDACGNDNIGYSQAAQYDNKDRTSLYSEAEKVGFDLSKITTPCNTDCSAFMAVCARAGGADVSKYSTTSSMASTFTASGAYIKKTDAKYFSSSDYLQRGDILVRAGSHTVMVLDNGSKVPASAGGFSSSIISSRDTSWINDFFAIRVAVSITNINITSVSATAKITKIDKGEEVDLIDKDTINLYDWTFNLKSLSNTELSPHSDKLAVNSNSTSFDLTALRPNTSYVLNVIAKEKNSKAEFSSPNIIFTTARDFSANNTKIDFVSAGSSKNNCKTFIKIGDRFNRTIFYNRREV